jgi:hypothetical protein
MQGEIGGSSYSMTLQFKRGKVRMADLSHGIIARE